MEPRSWLGEERFRQLDFMEFVRLLLELREREKEFDAAVELPRYMRADEDGGEPERQTKMQELEGLLGDVPFEHFAIESGQGESRVEVAKLKAKLNHRQK